MKKPKNQTHGAVESPNSIYDIIGYKHSPYQSSNAEEYKASIAVMHPTDLQEHATKVGVIPVDNREQLLSLLEKKFIQYQGLFRSSRTEGGVRMSAKAIEETKNLLRFGK